MVFCEHLLLEKTFYLCGMFQSGLGEKERFAQGKTYSTTGRSQSSEYMGDRVTLQWHYSDTTVTLQWHYSDTTVTLQWHYRDSNLDLDLDWGVVVYNQIVTWTAFAILAMFVFVSALFCKCISISTSLPAGCHGQRTSLGLTFILDSLGFWYLRDMGPPPSS